MSSFNTCSQVIQSGFVRSQFIKSVIPLLAVSVLGWAPFLTHCSGAETVVSPEATREQLDFFENEVRPLLVNHCFDCHSDGSAPDGELLLTSRKAMLQGGASGPSIIAGKPKESLLIEAVEYRSLSMPPNGKLKDHEIAALVKWVEMGAPWPAGEEPADHDEIKKKTFEITPQQASHWAFQKIRSPVPPDATDHRWNQTPVDQFLFAKFQQLGVTPNEPADRYTLLRRVTYDLIGMPPTPAEIQAFVTDESPEAWQKVVERLLASPHYGERWGRHWLDVVRYADTAGDASDYPMPTAYKYRDYVIKSFNDDKPYDQFLREQYAGDLIAETAPAEKYAELLTATTQMAISRRFGYNDTNFYYFHLTIGDLIDTMGQSVLGLSIGCARCHDHKFEPISANDYYALYGIFSSSKFTYPGGEEVQRPKDLVSTLTATETANSIAQRDLEISKIESDLQVVQDISQNLQGAFESSSSLQAPWGGDAVAKIVSGSNSPFQNLFPIGNQVVQIPQQAGNVGFRRILQEQTSESRQPLMVNLDFRNVSAETGGSGYSRLSMDDRHDFSPSFELFINGDHVAVRDAAGELQPVHPLEYGKWYNLQLTIDFSAKSFSGVIGDGQALSTFEAAPFNPGWKGTINSIVLDGHNTEAAAIRPLREFDNLVVSDAPLPAVNVVTDKTAATLEEELKAALALSTPLQNQKNALEAELPYPTIYGVVEGTPANTQLQFRGEPERLGEEVPRGFLEVLGGQKVPENSQESGRRELAEWLTSADNPLTSRVMVNRIWHYHFGKGLVTTPNDFGVRGSPPSHPELLDYLASEFMNHGYSIKSMHRLILNSRAYQLGSHQTASAQTLDPQNESFWRFERRRLDAESLRDSLLVISGELDPVPGGAHPFPPMNTWSFTQHHPFDAVYPSNKRSVYLMTQRIKRHPFLALFDGPDPNATTGKRESTTTPSQALYLMNDEFFHENSMKTAQILSLRSSEPQEQVRLFNELALGREISNQSANQALDFLQRYSERLPDDSDKPLESLAAYIRVILCSNEFLYLD